MRVSDNGAGTLGSGDATIAGNVVSGLDAASGNGKGTISGSATIAYNTVVGDNAAQNNGAATSGVGSAKVSNNTVYGADFSVRERNAQHCRQFASGRHQQLHQRNSLGQQ